MIRQSIRFLPKMQTSILVGLLLFVHDIRTRIKDVLEAGHTTDAEGLVRYGVTLYNAPSWQISYLNSSTIRRSDT